MTILETEQVRTAVVTHQPHLNSCFVLILAGDARNEVLTTTELAKLKFDPNHYRANAFQGLAYDPMRKSDLSSDRGPIHSMSCLAVYT